MIVALESGGGGGGNYQALQTSYRFQTEPTKMPLISYVKIPVSLRFGSREGWKIFPAKSGSKSGVRNSPSPEVSSPERDQSNDLMLRELSHRRNPS